MAAATCARGTEPPELMSKLDSILAAFWRRMAEKEQQKEVRRLTKLSPEGLLPHSQRKHNPPPTLTEPDDGDENKIPWAHIPKRLTLPRTVHRKDKNTYPAQPSPSSWQAEGALVERHNPALGPGNTEKTQAAPSKSAPHNQHGLKLTNGHTTGQAPGTSAGL
ncbi:Hypothetical predicted protein [Pelobates cultripes]|uniref:Uncharacterized protein n=1 Tax=Pelobates cultripes TaxID=61616 RepID=A0AAD1TLB0_PELCU|nr:Hypothetical predicted protein [Pelobates cultripes]